MSQHSIFFLLLLLLPLSHRQRPRNKTIIYNHYYYYYSILLLLLLPSLVSTQSIINNGCISLSTSKACPSYNKYYIGVPVLTRYGLNPNLTTIDEFDQGVNYYTTSAYSYVNSLECFSAYTNTSNLTFPYARYSKTRFCAALVQDSDSSLPCNYKYNVNPMPLCQSTCHLWLNSVKNIVTDNITACPNQGSMTEDFPNLASSCDYWAGYNGTTGNCIDGTVNEPNYCGFNDTDGACAYCQKNGTDTCCQTISSCPKQGGLSVGAIIGIVVAAVVMMVLLGLAFFCFCCKRQKRIRKENSFSFKTYIPPQQHQSTVEETDQYSGNKVLLQDDDPIRGTTMATAQMMTGTMNSNGTRHTHQSHLSDPFGDHYEVISLANNATTTTNTPTPTASTSATLIPTTTTSGALVSLDTNPVTASTTPPPTTTTTIEDGEPAYEEEFYKVIHPYPPQVNDELGLQVGDIVCLAMGFDDGWALGFNVTTGMKGVFPLVCVSLIPPSVLEQLLISSNEEDVTNDGVGSFSSKVLVEEDDSVFDQGNNNNNSNGNSSRLSRSSQLAISIRRIREDMRRSMSLSSSTTTSTNHHHHHQPSPLSANNSISRSFKDHLSSPSLLSHQTTAANIPRRTASRGRSSHNNNNNIATSTNYAECDSPTSPTHQTPLFNDTNHHLHQPSSPITNGMESFEMYHQHPKQESSV
ncbi:uncharacterized protein BX664DRAFT_387196 [Halteromyces radiatus]|uniref:uncharacterized protein n=1 Tax=Halteromyces radiatus TaxID=101107 RepID=UPI00221E4E89|nr:uncharacterized protein BX664DRAFT_387196 [Halteromyces radiatus]KAI8084460.1 hypothetical protein BX664DRAFT_387196 [Halteromyces radiatus]